MVFYIDKNTIPYWPSLPHYYPLGYKSKLIHLIISQVSESNTSHEKKNVHMNTSVNSNMCITKNSGNNHRRDI